MLSTVASAAGFHFYYQQGLQRQLPEEELDALWAVDMMSMTHAATVTIAVGYAVFFGIPALVTEHPVIRFAQLGVMAGSAYYIYRAYQRKNQSDQYAKDMLAAIQLAAKAA
jgi:hypothetical protein